MSAIPRSKSSSFPSQGRRSSSSSGGIILKEGWLMAPTSKKTRFLHRSAGRGCMQRCWGVLYQEEVCLEFQFYLDNHKDKSSAVKSFKIDQDIEGDSVLLITKMVENPDKYAFGMTLTQHKKSIMCCYDNKIELEQWLDTICDYFKIEYKLEMVYWEWHDETGLWQAFCDDVRKSIEENFLDQNTNFTLGDPQLSHHYNLSSFTRSHPRSKTSQRLRRTPNIWDRPEVLRTELQDLPAIWEWESEGGVWHPYERDTNKQIEQLYQSDQGKWMQLTMCTPSPTSILLDLYHMRQVNPRTGARRTLRRNTSTANRPHAKLARRTTSLEPNSALMGSDSSESDLTGSNMLRSPDYQKLQDAVKHLQYSRGKLTMDQQLGEGCFGEVYLGLATGLPGFRNSEPMKVAVKQLRLSDRMGLHGQQIEDFLREGKEMAKCDHPRVVKFLAVCTLDFPLLLIIEYMNEGDLLGVLHESRPHMPLQKELHFAIQVADGMDYLSTELNFIHRDLAARNILVHREDDTDKMEAKIADFGLSRHLYSTMYQDDFKKPRPLPAKWMALESLIDCVFTTKTDVWSYGVLLWEIMTLGRTPYPGIDNRDMLKEIEENNLQLSEPKDCPKAIYSIILQCTKHKPEQRPTFAELRDHLSIGYTGQSVVTNEEYCSGCSN
ncbi:fibroblast growth factor receptor 3-like isoform X2 [Dysidea avara]|uniref:fibroblast growth factor receptor 3-like isoform X2 n=1 Tax=Dysidea avara TaxID=196820 RepID=UPI00332DAFFC